MGKDNKWWSSKSSKSKINLSESYEKLKKGKSNTASERKSKDDYDDDDYYHNRNVRYDQYGFRQYTPNKQYSWNPTKWSNFNFNTFYGNEDDNSKLFVKDPISYITPTNSEIRDKLRTIWSQSAIDTVKELSRVVYFKMIDEKDYIAEKYADYDNLSESEQANYTQKKHLYDSIYTQFIPGATPLDQAVAIYHQISKKLKDNEDKGLRRKKGELVEGPEVPLEFAFDRSIYTDPEFNEQVEYNEISKRYKVEIMNHLSIIGDLGSQFKVEKEVDEKIVSFSDMTSKKIMRDYSQVPNIDLYQRLFPNYRLKLLTKDLVVTVPVEKKEKKQKIIMLLDFSGSMQETPKQIWVNALLIDRFKYVMKGEAEVYFSYFTYGEHNLKFKHIKDKQDVIDFWATFSNQPNGGGTDIGGIVEYIKKQIDSKQLHNLPIDLSEERPEILIINDGQDRVNSNAFPYKVNAISLMEFSDELKNLCVKTGGKQVRVKSNNEIRCYSSEGEQLINKAN